MAVKNIVYDLGNVLVKFDYAPVMKRLAELSGMPVAKLKPFIDINYTDFARGMMTGEEWHSFLCENLGFEMPYDEFKVFWADIFWLFEPMVELAGELRRSYPQYLLSNTDPIHIPWCFNRFPLGHLFDGLILSYEIGAYKPDFRIYEKGLEKFGLVPEECVFIDDLPANNRCGKSVRACGNRLRVTRTGGIRACGAGDYSPTEKVAPREQAV